MNIKTLTKKASTAALLGAAFTIGSVAYAAATIPAACSTPGTCTDITSTFQAVVSKTSMKFLDSDASNFVELKSPAVVGTDVILTLPDTDGDNGETLVTDGSGTLSWQSSPNDRFLGMIAFMIPNSGQHIWEINGQTVIDAKLATYITANPITGFSVSGDNVTLPDWRGRYLGASGNRGINSTVGTVMSSTNKRHRHSMARGYDGGGGTYYVHRANTSDTITGYTRYEGSTYARPETAGMPMVIIGGSL